MKKKDSWIQSIKGILIVLVVLGHAILPVIRNNSCLAYIAFSIIYSFHMFAFFFVSGWGGNVSI